MYTMPRRRQTKPDKVHGGLSWRLNEAEAQAAWPGLSAHGALGMGPVFH